MEGNWEKGKGSLSGQRRAGSGVGNGYREGYNVRNQVE